MKNKILLESSKPQISLEVVEFFSTYAYFYSPNFSFRGESHDAWEVIFVSSGEVVIETDTYTKTLSKGQIFIHVPNEFHKIRANGVTCNVCFISFSIKGDDIFSIARKVLTASEEQQKYIAKIIDEGLLFLAGKNYIPALNKKDKIEFGCSQQMKNFLEILLIELIRDDIRGTKSCTSAVVNHNEKVLIQYVINYLTTNINKKQKLEDIAANVGYSVSHLSAIFKESMDISIMNFFIKIRINKAKELIAENKMRIKEISEFLDFDSVQYFSSQFKKLTNITPSQYATIIKLKNFQLDDSMKLRIY